MDIRPANPAEAVVFKALKWTWPFYFVGALYVVGPILAWSLAALAFLSLYLGPAIRADLRARGPVPGAVWLWFAGMGVMLIALWVGHLDWGLGTKQTIKSSIGWAKGWALLALFPFVGSVLPIRREVLIRAQCIVGLWTLCLTPILFIAPQIGLPERLFTSPLKAIGGPGPEYFSVFLFTWDPSSWTPRWQFYAPWSPFAALLGVLQVCFALEEKSIKWRSIGIAAGITMILLSKSRMGMIGLVACTVGPRMLPLLLKGWAWQVLAGITASLAVVGTYLLQALKDGVAAFKGARADSTRVRETLQRIAGERWENEAYWFGHGTVQPGAHVVEFMPIGSHHTWWGLLFVKGLVGMLALLVPLAYQTLLALTDAARGPRGRLPLAVMMTIILLSFGENLEIEAYMLWPGLMILGIHAAEMSRDARARRQGHVQAAGPALVAAPGR
ncbi:O-antigen ligase domain-containing protein [Pseudooceanicola sediminis]|uniref:O-antigen ligase domain-containing protein n=1 Tax=Pseudooceanicola sediminis TaxID=2211117 RepID=A0A399J3V0_9RHOB|nr:O-antigen ligase domain-containing protein [Pseudooceanicola sediminis]KAA2314255.1 O-antigen ligase domain-containing protein [Puniceibacterium sp. HSS470]RII40078.1 O-antigen ligase domain-containing protein [Pseudooceanicola sediminis]